MPYQVPSYSALLYAEHPEYRSNLEARIILNSFSQYHAGLVEQSIRTYNNPSLNGKHSGVQLKFLNWAPGDSVLIPAQLIVQI